MKTVLIVVLLATGLFAAYKMFFQNKPSQNDITVGELKSRLISDTLLVLIDVRTDEEVIGPMPKLRQAIHIPLHELSSRVKELSKFKDREIAVICRSGNRSRAAVNILVENGYKAKNVPGGMSAYTRQ
ncbi:MAG: rhodanese-like domain-containing protein [Ignavibacteriales bacterium]|nr:rhodanese-like domain-containing protein [Ignavibacteriales bacterium]